MGHSLYDIATATGSARPAVRRKKNQQSWGEADKVVTLVLGRCRLPTAQIANLLGRAPKAVKSMRYSYIPSLLEEDVCRGSRGRDWNLAQENTLVLLTKTGIPMKVISNTLGRSENACRVKLKKLRKKYRGCHG